MEGKVHRVLAPALGCPVAGFGQEKCRSACWLGLIVVNRRENVERHVVDTIDVCRQCPLGDRSKLGRRYREAVVCDTGDCMRIVVTEMSRADVHTILVVPNVNGGVVVEARAALQAGRIDSSPRTHGVRRGADQQGVALACDGDDPTVDEFVVDDVRLVRPWRGGRIRDAWIGADRIQARFADEGGHWNGLQQVATLFVDPNVLPRDLHNLRGVDRNIHLRAIAVGHAGLACGQTGAAVAVEGVNNRLCLRHFHREQEAHGEEQRPSGQRLPLSMHWLTLLKLVAIFHLKIAEVRTPVLTSSSIASKDNSVK